MTAMSLREEKNAKEQWCRKYKYDDTEGQKKCMKEKQTNASDIDKDTGNTGMWIRTDRRDCAGGREGARKVWTSRLKKDQREEEKKGKGGKDEPQGGRCELQRLSGEPLHL
jgi:hypothetical protein